MIKCTTLCYIERDSKYLMLHRVKKENDINHDKWIGIGGHCEDGESPEDCIRREAMEETGYTLESLSFRGIVTFIYGEDITEYMMLFTSDAISGDEKVCDEGDLVWVDKKDVLSLNLWPGDRIFLKLLDERKEFFSLKLVYDTDDRLISAVLDGKSDVIPAM
jgi:8-oxo-dGTP diphosphatase